MITFFHFFKFFFIFSAVFLTPIIFTLRAIIMSCLRAQTKINPPPPVRVPTTWDFKLIQ